MHTGAGVDIVKIDNCRFNAAMSLTKMVVAKLDLAVLSSEYRQGLATPRRQGSW
jgi:hypothetical protein